MEGRRTMLEERESYFLSSSDGAAAPSTTSSMGTLMVASLVLTASMLVMPLPMLAVGRPTDSMARSRLFYSGPQIDRGMVSNTC